MDVDIHETNISDLLDILDVYLPDAKPGASGQVGAAFESYVKQRAKQNGHDTVAWARTSNMRYAEDRLLSRCDHLGCAYNVHRRSNKEEDVGRVYVTY